MRDNELVFTFKWPQGTNVKSVINPTAINPLAAEFAEKLIKQVGGGRGPELENATYELAGTTHNVPIKTGIAA